MPVSFPTTKRYFVSFRNSDTGLVGTLAFLYFKRTDTLASAGASPTFTEVQGGTYYFDIPFALATSPDIIFQIDGGASIPTEEIRYHTSMASPKDLFVDQPISQGATDVWSNNTVYGAGTKGKRVDDIGAAADTSAVASLFGKMLLYSEADTVSFTKLKGLMHENSVMDQTIFDGGNNLTSARFRIYNTKANALLAGAGGLQYTYTVTATYTGDNLLTYSVVLEP